ncbi:glycoside hydrolase family 24 protein [Taibaiella koreensis]|uniref:glycoside hydrolase family 24 protein n=1 Tax=Taibaiella koreensis TaxID=1268548 RepID=UPI001968AF42|nr:glycoside hydrolase family 104 protein [Taibaiella koreensis]
MITLISQVNNLFYGLLSKIGINMFPTINAPTNVKAFLMTIRHCEGTAGPNGYRMHFGGSLFSSFADHPRKVITKSGYSSSAAGAYQILTRTWDVVKKQIALPDFSPESQDKAAVQLIKNRGAYDAILSGDLRLALDRCNDEWASLPGSTYGQPTRSYDQCKAWFKQYGGVIS